MIEAYDWLKPARCKINIQKDWGEFGGVRIFSQACFRAKIGKNYTFFCQKTLMFGIQIRFAF